MSPVSPLPTGPLTDERLREIRERHARSTPETWYVGIPDIAFCECQIVAPCRNVWAGEGTDVTKPCAGLSPQDAEFVAHAHQDIPALLAELERLRCENDALKDAARRTNEVLRHQHAEVNRLNVLLGRWRESQGSRG